MKKYLPAIGIVLLALAGTIVAIVASQQNTTEARSTTSACMNKGSLHTATIKDNAFDNPDLIVQRCDRVKIINLDDTARRIALGMHDSHITYPGFQETSLGKDDSYTFTAFRAGHYHIHDHIHDSVEANIEIK